MAILKYRKKPVVIEAVQFDGKNYSEIASFMEGTDYCINPNIPAIFIPTLEGTMEASVGDFIIRGVSGEYYPCKPDIFDETYELVE